MIKRCLKRKQLFLFASHLSMRISVLLLIILLVASCKKEQPKDAVVGETQVEIVFLKPTSGESVSSNEQIHMEARIDADALMGGWRVNLIDVESSEVLNSYDDLYSQTQYFAHHHWILETDSAKNLQIEIFALNPSNEILTSKTIDFVVEP